MIRVNTFDGIYWKSSSGSEKVRISVAEKPLEIYKLLGSVGRSRAIRFGYGSVSVGIRSSGKGKPLEFLELEPEKECRSIDS